MIFFVDVQGTLIDDQDRKPIDGAIEFIDRLNEKKISYCIITNNTKQPSQEFLHYLRSLGFSIDEKQYIDPLMVLQKVLHEKKVAAYGVDGFLNALQNLGYELNYSDPDAVVLSVKNDYTFKEFGQIDEFLLGGAKLIGMHQTSIYAKDLRYPGVGALLAMFEYATGVKAQVVGKPSELFYKEALYKCGGKDFAEVVIVSDDPKGDLVGAKRLGMKTIFVLSGKFKRAEEILPRLAQKEQPDMIYPSVAEVMKDLL